MRARALGWWLAVGLPLHACGPDPAFRCDSDASCGPDGRCEPIGFCSFPDPRCDSGSRFAEHADAQVAGVCVVDIEGSSSDTQVSADSPTFTPGTDSTSTLALGSEGESTRGEDSGPQPSTGGSSEEGSTGEPDTLAEGLVVHLPLDDEFLARGGALDVSGNDLHAQCDACPTSVPGRVGMAAGFTADAVLAIADHPLLRPDAAMSVSVWALDADPTTMQTQLVVGKVVTGVYNTFQISTSAGATARADEMVFRLTEPGPVHHPILLTNPLEAETWHHLAGVWDGSTSSFWVDGVMVGEVEAAGLWHDAGPLVIGADDNDGFLYFWRGAIDEVRLYDRALTPAEVAELAAQQ
jgi:hypothetical protein